VSGPALRATGLVLRAAGLAVLLALMPGHAPAQGLPGDAADCVAGLAAAGDAAAADDPAPVLRDHCPAFLDALTDSPWADNLPSGLPAYLERDGLEALIAATAPYAAPEPRDISAERLDALVAALEPFVAEPEPSLWDRFVDWFNGLFETDDGGRSWLGELLASISIPEAVQKAMLYGILIVVVVFVLAILINELRIGGAFARRARRALGRVTITGRTRAEASVPTFDDIGRTPAIGRKIELLFTLVVDRVRQHYRGLLAPGLTHREIARAAGRLDTPARDSLAAIAGAAERVTYADWSPDDASWRRILADGEALVRRLADDDGAEGEGERNSDSDSDSDSERAT
jgi:hypothetical protein